MRHGAHACGVEHLERHDAECVCMRACSCVRGGEDLEGHDAEHAPHLRVVRVLDVGFAEGLLGLVNVFLLVTAVRMRLCVNFLLLVTAHARRAADASLFELSSRVWPAVAQLGNIGTKQLPNICTNLSCKSAEASGPGARG